MTSYCPRVVIAGSNSGVGKTSVSLALVSALRKRGFRVQTFKVGPDYLDPTYLALASGRPCYNLDGWMTGREYVRQLFVRSTAGADIAVIEGVMGLFDGADTDSLAGSTAEIALWLDAPVLLIVNAHGLARSIAPMVKGYAEFEPRVWIAGVIANHCGSERHGQGLSEVLSLSQLPKLVGAIPRGAFPELPNRHLGLVTADESIIDAGTLGALANVLEQHGSMDGMLRIACDAGPFDEAGIELRAASSTPRVRIGLACDEAFHFYYPDNLDALEAHGCELVKFSPLSDRSLPELLNGIYIGGGYPEEYAGQLAENVPMLDSVREFAQSGKPLYGECGGLMYMASGIETLDGKRHELVGLLPVWTRMLSCLKSLGYVEATLVRDSLFGEKGAELRGHEFHYSELLGDPTKDSEWVPAYATRRRRSDELIPEGFQLGRILLSYVHMHFASSPEAMEHFVGACTEASKAGGP